MYTRPGFAIVLNYKPRSCPSLFCNEKFIIFLLDLTIQTCNSKRQYPQLRAFLYSVFLFNSKKYMKLNYIFSLSLSHSLFDTHYKYVSESHQGLMKKKQKKKIAQLRQTALKMIRILLASRGSDVLSPLILSI